jgi:hypothetical protein
MRARACIFSTRRRAFFSSIGSNPLVRSESIMTYRGFQGAGRLLAGRHAQRPQRARFKRDHGHEWLRIGFVRYGRLGYSYGFLVDVVDDALILPIKSGRSMRTADSVNFLSGKLSLPLPERQPNSESVQGSCIRVCSLSRRSFSSFLNELKRA